MSIPRRVAALLVAAALALPAAAAAQAPTQTQTLPKPASGSSRPPVALGGGASKSPRQRPSSSRSVARRTLPKTGSDPRLLVLAGVALTLLGVGLRLRTADADVY